MTRTVISRSVIGRSVIGQDHRKHKAAQGSLAAGASKNRC